MAEIWEECTRFKTTSQRLADQAKTISRKGLLSDLEILEIQQQINRQSSRQDPNTIIVTLNTEKYEPSSRIEAQSISNLNTKHHRTNTNSRKN